MYDYSFTGETTAHRSAEGATTQESLRQKDRSILTLERDLILAEGAKLSGKYTDGYKELIWKQKKHRYINYTKIVMQNL